MALQMFVRHRQAELTDSEWLAEYERQNCGPSVAAHGLPWRDRREATDPKVMRLYRPFRKLRSSVWLLVFTLFGGFGLFMLIASLTNHVGFLR